MSNQGAHMAAALHFRQVGDASEDFHRKRRKCLTFSDGTKIDTRTSKFLLFSSPRRNVLMLPLSSVLVSLVCFALLCMPCTASHYRSKATLTIFDFTSWSYRAEIAQFGNPMDEHLVYHATLMIPPTNYSQLCEVPDFLTKEALQQQQMPVMGITGNESLGENNNPFNSDTTTTSPAFSDSIAWQFAGPVALLVSLGGCDPRTKALVALDLHRRITQDLKYIVFYNNNPNDPDNIVTLSTSSITSPSTMESGNSEKNENSSSSSNVFGDNGDDQEEQFWHLLEESMVFVSVSTGTGSAILGRMDRLASSTGSTPEFKEPKDNTLRWHLVSVASLYCIYSVRHPNCLENFSNHFLFCSRWSWKEYLRDQIRGRSQTTGEAAWDIRNRTKKATTLFIGSDYSCSAC
jgi:hypothetical protein